MKLSAVAFVLAVLLQAAFAQTTVTLAVLSPSVGNIQYQEKPIYATLVTPAVAGTVTVYVDGNSDGSCQTTATSGACNVTGVSPVLTVGFHQAISSFTTTGGATTNSSVITFQVYAVTILTTTSNPAGPNIPAGVVTFTVSTQNVPSTINGPSGTITFIDASHGGASIGSCIITGVPTCSANATLSPGSNYTVFASYNGDTVYDTAFSASIFLVVGAATTATTAATSTTVATTAATTTAATSTAATTTGNMTTATLTSSTSTTAASSTSTTATTTAATATGTTTTAATSTTAASTSTTTVAATTTMTSSTTATPSPVPTTTGTTAPTGPTTSQITTANNTHPTAAPTKAPTSSAAWTLPSVVVSAVVIALSFL